MIDWYWILAMMLFCHVIEDFHIQGILADLKQRHWWKLQTGESRYYNDYIPSILAHGFEWSVFIHIPLMYAYGFIPSIFASIVINSFVHAYIDDLKCNRHKLNLVQDQSLHVIEIIITMSMITLLA